MRLPKQILFALIFFSTLAFPQFSIRGAMGIDLVKMSSVQDYLNVNYAYTNKLNSFNTAAAFSVEFSYRNQQLTGNSELGLDLGIGINSFNYDLLGGTYKLSYSLYKPTAMWYQVIPGNGYQVRFGGGIGPRFLALAESIPPLSASKDYSSTGFGIIGRVDGSTKLAEHTFVYIGGDLQYDRIPEPNNDNGIVEGIENISFNSFAVGLKLGVVYFF